MGLIPGYEKGANVLLLNTVYVRPHKQDSGKWTAGTLYLTYRDLDTYEKSMVAIENPEVETYITKQHLRHTFGTQREYMRIEDVDKYVVPYKDMTKFLRNKIKEDGVDLSYVHLYDTAVREGQSRLKKELYKWRHSYEADINIEDYAIIKCFLDYDPKEYYITKSYLDIECDVYHTPDSDYALENGLSQITEVSYIVDHEPDGSPTTSPYVFEFLLRDHALYPQQEYFEKHIAEFEAQCHREFDKEHGKCRYKFLIFDDEIEMLTWLMGLIRKTKSDFIHIYNMSFDIQYITRRLQFLGVDPSEFFCHPDFKDELMDYRLDAYHKNDLKNRTDSFECTCLSRYVDSMLNYAGIRKSVRDYGSNALDNVAKIELGVPKRKFKNKLHDVINGIVKAYWEFTLYSINDSLLLMSLERQVQDTQALFEQSYTGGTRMSATLKQSVYLKNVYIIDYHKKMGLVLDNNKNIDYTNSDVLSEADQIDLVGALVGRTELNEANGAKIFGKPSKYLFFWTVDFDFAAMYPNHQDKFGMAKSRQHGRLLIPKQIIADENPTNDIKFLRAGLFVGDLVTRNYIHMGRWFGLKPATVYMEEFKNLVA